MIIPGQATARHSEAGGGLPGQGGEEIRCEEWAEKLGTITYEVTCQVNPRVERVYDPY